MLVVKSPNPNERGRTGIEQLNVSLLKMLEKCRKDRNYASQPAPWSQRRADYRNKGEAVETNVATLPANILRFKDLRVHRGKTLVRGRLPYSHPGEHETPEW